MSEAPLPRATPPAVDHAARLRERAEQASRLALIARARWGLRTLRLAQALLTPIPIADPKAEAAADREAQAARRGFREAMDLAYLARALARAAEEGPTQSREPKAESRRQSP